MEPKVKYAVLLHPKTPKELLSAVEDYVYSARGMLYLLSWRFDAGPYFAELEIVHTSQKLQWKVQVPVSCILAVMDLSEENKKPPWFENPS